MALSKSKSPPFTWQTPVLCVSDLSASLRHYQEVLGFGVSWAWNDDEAFENPEKPTFACVYRGECFIFLCEQGQGNPGSWLCMNLESLEELERVHKEYQASGAEIVEPPTDCSWGMREMIVRDLDGNTFRIGCALSN